MPLNLKNAHVERLVTEISSLTGESKTEAVRVALEERRERLRWHATATGEARMRQFLEQEVWPTVPSAQLGRRLTEQEEDDVLGHGPEGV